MSRKIEKRISENAVSPVVGVMLMLVVTIIVAAVVANFATGLAGTQEQTPMMSADIQIVSADTYRATYGSFGKFEMSILSTSETIATKDLKIITYYSTTNRTNASEMIIGGNTTIGTGNNTRYKTYEYNSPIGYGQGIYGIASTSGSFTRGQHFGQYRFEAGTVMQSIGAADYSSSGMGSSAVQPVDKYIEHAYHTNALDAILGDEWTHLRPGDEVTVQMFYIPTGGVIFSKSVVVQ